MRDGKDFYTILGISREAKEDEIKSAFRRLALKYHPDRNPGDKNAEEKFKEINEAYQVLSDSQKRARYDQLGSEYSRWQRSGGAPGGFNWEDWFTTPRGGGVRVEMGDLDSILGGGFSEFFRRIFGGMDVEPGYVGGRTSARPRAVATPSYQNQVTISLDEAYHGTTRHIEVNGRRLEVRIPSGSRTGTKVRIPGVGPAGTDGRKGDLYLVIEVSPDPRFERKGSNLHTQVEVDVYRAVLGSEVRVPTPAGDVMLTIPAGTQPGQTFRLKGRGMPYLNKPTQHGDLLVTVKVRIPQKLTDRERSLFEELAKKKAR